MNGTGTSAGRKDETTLVKDERKGGTHGEKMRLCLSAGRKTRPCLGPEQGIRRTNSDQEGGRIGGK
jgi:hypothetical protein